MRVEEGECGMFSGFMDFFSHIPMHRPMLFMLSRATHFFLFQFWLKVAKLDFGNTKMSLNDQNSNKTWIICCAMFHVDDFSRCWRWNLWAKTYTVGTYCNLHIFLCYLHMLHVLHVVSRKLQDVGRNVFQHCDEEQAHGAVDFVLQNFLQFHKRREKIEKITIGDEICINLQLLSATMHAFCRQAAQTSFFLSYQSYLLRRPVPTRKKIAV